MEIPKNTVQSFEIEGDDLVSRIPQPLNILTALSFNIDLFHVVTDALRPGTLFFQTYLEHEFFPPMDDDLSAQLQVRLVNWEDMYFSVVTVPIGKKQFCLDAAKATGMILKEGEVPFLFHGGGVKQWPMTAERLAYLKSDPESAIYKGFGGIQDECMVENFKRNEYLKSKGVIDND